MGIYRPRMAAELTLPKPWSDTDTLLLRVNVQSARLKRNDQNHADELQLTLDWHDAGMDPRLLSSAIVTFYLANADDNGDWDPGPENVQFVGRMTRPMRRAGEDQPMMVEANFTDYTSFFILAKTVAAAAIPTYQMTVADAWRTLCEGLSDQTGSSPVAELADSIVFRGLDAPGPVIGKAVAPRFQKSQVHVDPKHDAWAIWQQIVGSVGLISFFEADTLVVTTATDFYTADNTPVFLWGVNIASFEEERNNEFERKGVGITSFDPTTGTTIEAVWPPIGDPRVRGKKVKAKKGAAGLASKENRDYFQFAGITDPPTLLALAQRVYEERARQEFQGKITTSEMSVNTTDAELFDLLTVRSGDTIQIKIDEIDWDGSYLQSLPSMSDRVAWLTSRGYSDDVAAIIAANLDLLVSLRREFYVKTVEVEFTTTEEGGTFQVQIGYCNKIETNLNADDDASDYT